MKSSSKPLTETSISELDLILYNAIKLALANTKSTIQAEIDKKVFNDKQTLTDRLRQHTIKAQIGIFTTHLRRLLFPLYQDIKALGLSRYGVETFFKRLWEPRYWEDVGHPQSDHGYTLFLELPQGTWYMPHTKLFEMCHHIYSPNKDYPIRPMITPRQVMPTAPQPIEKTEPSLLGLDHFFVSINKIITNATESVDDLKKIETKTQASYREIYS